MGITIKKHASGNSLDITYSDGTTKSYQRGDGNFRPSYKGNNLTVVNYADQFVHPELNSVPFGSITNGETSSVFANIAAVKDYIDTGFFRSASVAAGSGSTATYASVSGSTQLTKSALNTAYPAYKGGDTIYQPSANLKYVKMDSSSTGEWDVQPYNPAP